MLKRLGICLLAVSFLLGMLPGAVWANTTTQPAVSIEVSSSSVSVGNQVTVTVKVTGGVDVYGSSVDLTYNPNLLQLIEAVPGPLVTNGLSSSQFYTTSFPTEVTGGKRSTAIALRLGNQLSGVTASGVLATYTFEALAVGAVDFTVGAGSVEVQMVNSAGANIPFTPPASPVRLTITPPEQVQLKLTPSATMIAKDGTFTVDVMLAAAKNVAGVDVQIAFPANLLQVVDADVDTDGLQVTPGTIFGIPGTNTADNAAGTIRYAAARGTGYTNAGEVKVASITFSAKNVGAADLSFTNTLVKDPNTAAITHLKTGTSVSVVTGAKVTGQLLLQGRTAPNLGGARIKVVGQPISVTTGPDGAFTLEGIPAGTRQLLIRFPDTSATGSVTITYLNKLVTLENLVVGENRTLASMELRGGDANGDNVVELSDLILLAISYGKSKDGTATGYDHRADFNADNVVELSDLIILATNYGQEGATVPPGE